MIGLVDIFETLVLPNGRRIALARFASRYFLLTGHKEAPAGELEVDGPYDTRIEVRRRARLLQNEAYQADSAARRVS